MQPELTPFLGLRAFDASDSPLFFGRDAHIEQLVRLLDQSRLLAVVGASGSGKSSLVRCGLLSTLSQQSPGVWKAITITPGSEPILAWQQAWSQYTQSSLPHTRATAPNALVEAYHHHSPKGYERLIWVIDQFEEVLQDGEAQRAFIAQLLYAITSDAPIYIVLTLRASHLSRCTQYPGLAEAINQAQFLVPRMTQASLRAAIEGPIAVVGATIAPQLTQRLLRDADRHQQALPLLQHALMRTWQYWVQHEPADTPIAVSHYEAVGALDAALDQHAEEVWSALPHSEDRHMAEVLFKALTEEGADHTGLRRPQSLAELEAIVGASPVSVIAAFSAPEHAFLMPVGTTDWSGTTRIDISHESLITIWKRLARWVREEQESATTYQRLAAAAALYQSGEGGLWRDPELAIGLRWRAVQNPTAAWAQRYDTTYDRAMSFLAYSAEQNAFEQQEADRLQHQRLRRARRIAVVVGIAAILALLLATYAIYLRAEAVNQRNLAVAAQAEEVKARSLAERNEATAQRERARAEEQRQLAEANAREADRQRNIALVQREVAIAQEQEAQRQRLIAEEQRTVAERQRNIANEQRMLAKANADLAEQNAKRAEANALLAAAKAQEAYNNARIAQRERNLALARSMALEAQQRLRDGQEATGKRLALEAYDRLATLPDAPMQEEVYQALVATWQHFYPSEQAFLNNSSIKALVSTAAGLWIADEQGRVQRLTSSGALQVRHTLAMPRKRWEALATDGRYLLLGAYDGTLCYTTFAERPSSASKLNTVRTAQLPQPIRTLVNIGPRQFVGLSANAAWLIQWEDGEAPRMRKLVEGVQALTWSESDKALLAAQREGIVYYRPSADDWQAIRVLPQLGEVTALSVSPDGKWCAAGGKNGRITLWPEDGGPRSMLFKHLTAITALRWQPASAAGWLLASVSLDNTGYLTTLSTQDHDMPRLPLKGHKKWIYDAAFSADGQRLFTIGEDHQLKVWPTDVHQLYQRLATVSPTQAN